MSMCRPRNRDASRKPWSRCCTSQARFLKKREEWGTGDGVPRAGGQREAWTGLGHGDTGGWAGPGGPGRRGAPPVPRGTHRSACPPTRETAPSAAPAPPQAAPGALVHPRGAEAGPPPRQRPLPRLGHSCPVRALLLPVRRLRGRRALLACARRRAEAFTRLETISGRKEGGGSGLGSGAALG